MTRHFGHDHQSGYRFVVTAIDLNTRTVAIRYDETAWAPGARVTERLAWNDFLQHVIDGRFEFRQSCEPPCTPSGSRTPAAA